MLTWLFVKRKIFVKMLQAMIMLQWGYTYYVKIVNIRPVRRIVWVFLLQYMFEFYLKRGVCGSHGHDEKVFKVHRVNLLAQLYSESICIFFQCDFKVNVFSFYDSNFFSISLLMVIFLSNFMIIKNIFAQQYEYSLLNRAHFFQSLIMCKRQMHLQIK